MSFASDKDYLGSFLVIVCGLALIASQLLPLPIMAEETLQSLFERALEKSSKGDCLAALKDWEKFLEISPRDPAAISNRGNCLLLLGDAEGAIDAQSEALELLPFNQDAHLNRGIAEEALHQWDAAENDYLWILERNPDESSALYNLGNVKASQGDWTAAKTLFEKASLVRPEFAMAQSNKALVEYQLGELDQAQSDLRLIIRKYPMFADARAALSALLSHNGLKGEAESHWAAAIGLDTRYRDRDWLSNIRRWPTTPINDLMDFLDLKVS